MPKKMYTINNKPVKCHLQCSSDITTESLQDQKNSHQPKIQLSDNEIEPNQWQYI